MMFNKRKIAELETRYNSLRINYEFLFKLYQNLQSLNEKIENEHEVLKEKLKNIHEKLNTLHDENEELTNEVYKLNYKKEFFDQEIEELKYYRDILFSFNQIPHITHKDFKHSDDLEKEGYRLLCVAGEKDKKEVWVRDLKKGKEHGQGN